LNPGQIYSLDRIQPIIDAGLDISTFNDVTLSASIHYVPASTTTTVGGRVSLRIPLT
jgi:hypothetical protein